jgi:hypothetical protein
MIARRRCVLELGPQIPSASLIMLSFRSGSVDVDHSAATRRILRPLEECWVVAKNFGRWPSKRKKYPDRSATEGHKPGKRKPDKHVVSVHDRVLRNDIDSTANSVTSAAPMYYRDTRIQVLLLRANDLFIVATAGGCRRHVPVTFPAMR